MTQSTKPEPSAHDELRAALTASGMLTLFDAIARKHGVIEMSANGGRSDAMIPLILAELFSAIEQACAQWQASRAPVVQAGVPDTPCRNPREFILGAVARGWCSEANGGKEMDSDLAYDIACRVEEALAAAPSAPQAVAAPERDAMESTLRNMDKYLGNCGYGADHPWRIEIAAALKHAPQPAAALSEVAATAVSLSESVASHLIAAPASRSFCGGAPNAAIIKMMEDKQAAQSAQLNSDWGDAAPAASQQPVPALSASIDSALTQRDAYHDIADNLASAIAAHFGADIGEHSSSNCPWDAALEVIENATPIGAPCMPELTDDSQKFEDWWNTENGKYSDDFRPSFWYGWKARAMLSSQLVQQRATLSDVDILAELEITRHVTASYSLIALTDAAAINFARAILAAACAA